MIVLGPRLGAGVRGGRSVLILDKVIFNSGDGGTFYYSCRRCKGRTANPAPYENRPAPTS